MENYYVKLVNNIENLISKKEFDTVKQIIEEELSMPYIPENIEFKLKEIFSLIEEREEITKVISDETELANLLKGTVEQQLSAINSFTKLNARNYYEIINDYFKASPRSELAGLLIDILINQGINEEFTYIKDNVEYVFIPKQLLNPYEADGFVSVARFLSDKLTVDYQDLFEISMANLSYYAYSLLPLTIEEDEALDLSYYLAYYSFKALDNESQFFELFDISDNHLQFILKKYHDTIQ